VVRLSYWLTAIDRSNIAVSVELRWLEKQHNGFRIALPREIVYSAVRCSDLDSRIRGALEQAIDNLMEKDIVVNVGWIGEEIPIKSVNDLALGYVDGVIAAVAASVFTSLLDRRPSDEDANEVRAIIRRRLPEIVRKIHRELNK
jgi:hypothetical protein